MTSPDQPRPTDQDDLKNYFQLRVTTPHADSDKLWEIFSNYSRHFIYCKHPADAKVNREHFHCAFMNMTVKEYDAMRKKLRTDFQRSGNEFMSGKHRDNGVHKYVQYVRHYPRVDETFRYRGPGWLKVIEESPDYEMPGTNSEATATPSKKRERLSDPVLSYYNIVKQAVKHCRFNNIKTTDLRVALEHMVRTSDWIPDIHIIRRGLDQYHHDLFKYRMSERAGPTPLGSWVNPRAESDYRPFRYD